MNATATKTAATEATSDTKPINKMSRDELQAKKADLNQQLDDTANLDKYDALSKEKRQVLEAIQKLDAMREGELEDIGNKIVQHKIKLSELSDAARQMLGAVVAQAAAAAPAKKSTGKSGPKTQFEGDVLIKIENGSRPAEYKKGYLAAKNPTYVGVTFKELFEAKKEKFAEALSESFTPEGKTYFVTEEGKAELTKFVEFVKTKKVLPTAKKK